MAAKLHVAHNVGPQRCVVRERRTAETGMKLGRDGAAATRGARLEHDRLQAGPGEVERRGQPVVPAADDDDSHARVSASILIAALRPGAPMMPPPGMGRRPAHVQVLDRRLVLRPARRRAKEEQLLERQLTLEDVAFRQPPLAFEIERRDHLPLRMMFGRLGAYSASVLTTVSPNASRWSSHVPSAR